MINGKYEYVPSGPYIHHMQLLYAMVGGPVIMGTYYASLGSVWMSIVFCLSNSYMPRLQPVYQKS